MNLRLNLIFDKFQATINKTEGYYVFEDGTEMKWVSFWINDEGASSDGIVISTMDAGDAGGWARKLTSYDTYPYICERDD